MKLRLEFVFVDSHTVVRSREATDQPECNRNRPDLGPPNRPELLQQIVDFRKASARGRLPAVGSRLACFGHDRRDLAAGSLEGVVEEERYIKDAQKRLYSLSSEQQPAGTDAAEQLST